MTHDDWALAVAFVAMFDLFAVVFGVWAVLAA